MLVARFSPSTKFPNKINKAEQSFGLAVLQNAFSTGAIALKLSAVPTLSLIQNGQVSPAVNAIPGGGCGYRRIITAASSQEIARYIRDETIARMVMPVITMFILKI